MRWRTIFSGKKVKKIAIVAHDSFAHGLFASIIARNLHSQTEHKIFGALGAEDLANTPVEDFELIYPVKKDLLEIVPYFLAERFDLLINLSSDPTFQKLQDILEPAFVIDQNWHKRPSIHRFWAKENTPANHVVDHLLNGLTNLGVKNDQSGLQLNLTAAKPVKLIEIFDPFIYSMMYHGGFVLYFIGKNGSCAEAQLVAHCASLSQPVLLVCRQEDDELADAVAKACRPNVINAAVLSNLSYLPSLIEQCQMVFVCEQELSHILGAFSKPVVLVEGIAPTVPIYFPVDKRHLLQSIALSELPF